MKRGDGRAWNELRPTEITTGFQSFAEGSALITMGKTRVLCAVSVEERVPLFLRDSRTGWITAEYAMLPRSTLTRTPREVAAGHVSGRSQEIQRLVGRSMRAVVDLVALGERTLIIDCDVLQADGGTRAAAITGSYVALHVALERMVRMGVIREMPLRSAVAAVSVGVVHGRYLLDLCYDEDSAAEVDFNVAMNSRGEFVEVQGTAEQRPFDRETLDSLLELARKGISELFEVQRAALDSARTD